MQSHGEIILTGETEELVKKKKNLSIFHVNNVNSFWFPNHMQFGKTHVSTVMTQFAVILVKIKIYNMFKSFII
jgi:hypothetical protein